MRLLDVLGRTITSIALVLAQVVIAALGAAVFIFTLLGFANAIGHSGLATWRTWIEWSAALVVSLTVLVLAARPLLRRLFGVFAR